MQQFCPIFICGDASEKHFALINLYKSCNLIKILKKMNFFLANLEQNAYFCVNKIAILQNI